MIPIVFLCVLANQPETSEITIREDGLSGSTETPESVSGVSELSAAEAGVGHARPTRERMKTECMKDNSSRTKS